MLTIEEVERNIVAASLKKEWSENIDLNLIEEQAGIDIAMAGKLMIRNNDPISISSLSMKLQQMGKTVSDITLKEIFMLSLNLKDEKLINEYKAILYSRRKKRSLLEEIEKVRKYVLEDRFDEAIALVKSLRFQGNVQKRSSMSWIMDSIISTNGFSSGLGDIDISGGLLKKNIMTISGDSGSQKTMFAQNFCLKILRKNKDFTGIFFEKEMPLEDLGRRIASWILRVDSNEIMQAVSSARTKDERDDKLIAIQRDIDKKLDADKEIKDIVDRLELISRDSFSDAIDIWKILVDRKPDIWVLDFFTMLEPKIGGLDDETMRQQAILLKNAVLDTDTFGIILSQLKQSNNVDQRINKVPLIGDMEWGKHLRQYSTWVFSILYPQHYKITVEPWYFYLVSRKTRHGKSIIVPLKSFPETADFFEPNAPEKKAMMKWIESYMHKGDNYDKFNK